MGFVQDILSKSRPETIRSVSLPQRTAYFPSPSYRRDEVIYFLLPDRFSDDQESGRPLLDEYACPVRYRV
jgi:hypothetical protein